jgi:hypothetical protein
MDDTRVHLPANRPADGHPRLRHTVRSVRCCRARAGVAHRVGGDMGRPCTPLSLGPGGRRHGACGLATRVSTVNSFLNRNPFLFIPISIQIQTLKIYI